ncbi:MAG TPA: efflux RND transporter periplasmic adaptor subunit [Chthoniobacterales bacterium]|jgi:membrane fusion protein, multidrug efflux system
MRNIDQLNVATRRAVGDLEQRFGRKRLYIIGGAILLVLLIGLLRIIGGGHKAPPPPPPHIVLVSRVITKDAPVYLDEIGTCSAVETVQVQAQVSGQIISRDFQDGADVKKGDLLFRIDPRPYQAALDQTQGLLAQAKSQLVLDQITLKRQQELRARNVVSPQDLDTAQGTVNSDEAKVKSAEAAVAAAQVNLDYCSIRSPIDGRAGLRNIDTGNIVTGGSGGGGGAVLLTIQRIDPIYTDFTIAETDLPQVRRYLDGPTLKVLTATPDDASDDPKTGALYFIDNAVQSGAGTVKARAVTPNPDRKFWPEEFVRVRLILDTIKEAKLVPSQAVQISQNGPYLFIVKADNTVDMRPVKPGQPQDGDTVVIEEGAKAGETVVVTGQIALAPGVKVAPQPYKPAEGGAKQ